MGCVGIMQPLFLDFLTSALLLLVDKSGERIAADDLLAFLGGMI